MKKILFTTIASASAFLFAPGANAATTLDCTTSAQVGVATAGGSAGCTPLAPTTSAFQTGFFNERRDVAGAFETFFTFRFPNAGSVSSNASTIINIALEPLSGGVQFQNVFLGTEAFTLTTVPVLVGGLPVFQNGVQLFTQFAQLQTTIGGTGPQDLAIRVVGTSLSDVGSFNGQVNINAVPEPATWAMLLVGFGAVGYSMRRRPRYRLVQAV